MGGAEEKRKGESEKYFFPKGRENSSKVRVERQEERTENGEMGGEAMRSHTILPGLFNVLREGGLLVIVLTMLASPIGIKKELNQLLGNLHRLGSQVAAVFW